MVLTIIKKKNVTSFHFLIISNQKLKKEEKNLDFTESCYFQQEKKKT